MKLNEYYQNKYSNNHYNKLKKSNKFTNTLIILLIIILGFLAFKIYSTLHKPKIAQAFKTQALQQLTNNKVEDWQNKITQLQTKFQRDDSINVLEGEAAIEITYTDKDIKGGANNAIGFLQKKFAELQSKSITVNTKYKFGYSFPLNKLEVQNLNDGNIKIKLYQSDLDLKYIDEETEETTLQADYNFLAKKFTPSEIAAIMNTTKLRTRNNLMSNKDLRNKSVEYAEQTIKDMAKGFGFNNVEVEIIPDNLIENDEVTIKDITY